MTKFAIALLALLLALLLAVPMMADDPCEDDPNCDDGRAPGHSIVCPSTTMPILLGVGFVVFARFVLGT